MKTIKIERQTPYFDQDTTAIIKGIALVMMFVHHFFTFPTWWIDGIAYPFLEDIAPYFCQPLKLCVSIFCFLTGYFYYYSTDKTYSYSARKITDIFIYYWTVLFLFAFLAIVKVHYVYTPISFLKEMFALERPTMRFCWYVYFYYLIMLILPLLTKLMSKSIYFDFFYSVILIPSLIWGINQIVTDYIGNALIGGMLESLLSWFPTVLVGFVFARYGLLDRMADYNSRIYLSKKIAILLWIIGALCAPMGRYVLPSFTLNFGVLPIIHHPISISILLDFVYAPIFIYCLVNLCINIRLYYTQFILKQIGKYSLLMWFVSCIFYNNSKLFFQPILYWPRNPVLVLVWGLWICYSVSVILNIGLSIIIKQKNKIIFHKV